MIADVLIAEWKRRTGRLMISIKAERPGVNILLQLFLQICLFFCIISAHARYPATPGITEKGGAIRHPSGI
jgi:hypothetical protein